MKQDIFLIEAAHDWVILFVCSKRLFYSINLKTQWFEKEDIYVYELIAIEKMPFNELNKIYELELMPSVLEQIIEKWENPRDTRVNKLLPVNIGFFNKED